jgi:hypothetical protein
MGRHIASRRRHVTRSDSVEGASRHVTPPFRGVTCDAALVDRVGRGSLTGRWEPRPRACPNIRGGITIERDVPAGAQLWLTGWTKSIAGGEFVLLIVEIADEDGRPSW